MLFESGLTSNEHNKLGCSMFNWAVIFSIWIIELVKYSSHFPQLVIIFICLVRFIFIVTPMYKSEYMTESVSFHSVSIKGHEVLFQCRPVILQRVPLIVPHLHNNNQKQTHFPNSPARQWGQSFVQCVQVLVIKCLSTTNSCTTSKKRSMKTLSGEVCIDVGASVVITHWHLL